ncbi:Na+/H+ antiporter NhaC [Desulfosediminicola flagellatus]|uniref:Na+/H+ antiporter NhaC n=1 Tax=Desulfosediminicola flagellatus TaxID=2569541 RepID=UPI0010AB8C98|nr:Na+/H+ antiporter NhaC [Desulfosediminicola flagellatus]
MSPDEKAVKPISAFLAMIGLVIILAVCLQVLKLPTRGTLVLCIVYLASVTYYLGNSLSEIEGYLLDGFKKASFTVGVLMAVGCVIGGWIIGGVIPSIIYYGLELLTPSLYLTTGLILCCLTSYFTGTSYGCIATMGVALIGVAEGLGVPLPIAAGMVVSGALFGDKMSPFSDTTNLAAATAKTPLFSHIYSMLFTGGPAIVISLIIFAVIGMNFGDAQNANPAKTQELMSAIDSVFFISPFLLLVPAVTILMIIKKVPPIMSIMIGSILGVLAGMIFQDAFTSKEAILALFKGVSYDYGNADAAKLLNRGGLGSMAWIVTVALIVLAFGELIQRSGILKALLTAISNSISSSFRLILATIGACLATNLFSASQYVSIVLPGETFEPAYRRMNIKGNVLSRTLEDSGTLFAFLVPWGNDAIFTAATLGVATLDYAPYTFFSLLCPLLAIFYAATGKFIWKRDEEEITEFSLDTTSQELAPAIQK